MTENRPSASVSVVGFESPLTRTVTPSIGTPLPSYVTRPARLAGSSSETVGVGSFGVGVKVAVGGFVGSKEAAVPRREHGAPLAKDVAAV